MALAGADGCVARLTFGHNSEAAARRSLGRLPSGVRRDDVWFGELVERLQAYARGALDDFRDVAVDLGELTEFAAMVVDGCRQIPPGATLSYGNLAAACGRRGAARAVGNVMRTNRVPIIVPCHRVVGGDGRMHGYSAAGGIDTKRRLLELELSSRVWAGVAEVVGVN
jgi:methylated-DNA-[protein]-cysteine S-methyltransferase